MANAVSIHIGDLVVFGYAAPGIGMVQRQGQVDRIHRCKAGHITLTILDDDRKTQPRQFKLHKLFVRTVIPCVKNPVPYYYAR